jgi:hypothetical protein
MSEPRRLPIAPPSMEDPKALLMASLQALADTVTAGADRNARLLDEIRDEASNKMAARVVSLAGPLMNLAIVRMKFVLAVAAPVVLCVGIGIGWFLRGGDVTGMTCGDDQQGHYCYVRVGVIKPAPQVVAKH